MVCIYDDMLILAELLTRIPEFFFSLSSYENKQTLLEAEIPSIARISPIHACKLADK